MFSGSSILQRVLSLLKLVGMVNEVDNGGGSLLSSCIKSITFATMAYYRRWSVESGDKINTAIITSSARRVKKLY